MPELSPTAQAVFEAFNSKFEWIEDGVPGPQFKGLAAVLRVIADLVRMDQPLGDTDADAGVFAAHQFIHGYIAEIAAELDAYLARN